LSAATHLTTEVAEREIDEKRGEVITIARGITITDQATYERAASHLTAVKALLVKVGETFDDLVSAAHKAHKLLVERRKQHTDPLLDAERLLKLKMSAYVAEQERIARQRAAEAEARAREEAEARRLEEAAELEAAGESEAAMASLDAPVLVVLPPPPPIAVPKAEGITSREVWHGEVTDLAALVKAIAEGKAPITFITPATSQVSQWARATRGSVQVPGVRVWSTKEIAARAR
jgi:hypothetical protein